MPGGSGQVGTILARAFHAEGHEVIVLSRKQTAAPNQQSAKKQKKEKSKGEEAGIRRGKPIVTNVPGANLDGNEAWKKAIKTVQTTANSVGLSTQQIGADDHEEKKQKEYEEWWYAGYYAGLAAAAARPESTMVHDAVAPSAAQEDEDEDFEVEDRPETAT